MKEKVTKYDHKLSCFFLLQMYRNIVKILDGHQKPLGAMDFVYFLKLPKNYRNLFNKTNKMTKYWELSRVWKNFLNSFLYNRHLCNVVLLCWVLLNMKKNDVKILQESGRNIRSRKHKFSTADVIKDMINTNILKIFSGKNTKNKRWTKIV